MDSQTRTTTVPNTVIPVSEIGPNIAVSNGQTLTKEELPKLPDPKSAPQEVETPEDDEDLENRMASDADREKNRGEWEAYNESEWAAHLVLREEVESITPAGFRKAEEDEEDKVGPRHILAGMSFQNGHQVNQLLLADPTKRDEAFRCKCFPDLIIQQATDNSRLGECSFEAPRPQERMGSQQGSHVHMGEYRLQRRLQSPFFRQGWQRNHA
jgi:hypothetical protein